MKRLTFFLFLLLAILFQVTSFAKEYTPLLKSSNVDNIPTFYKGHFHPISVYSQYWLYDIYHDDHFQDLPQENIPDASHSPLDFLWRMHFLGHTPWDDAEIFWIRSGELTKLLQLSGKRDRFSYNEISKALFKERSSNLSVVQRLITYYYFQGDRSFSKRRELTELSPGLWVKKIGSRIVVLSSPQKAPWHFLTRGSSFSILHPVHPSSFIESYQQLSSALKEYEHAGDHSLALNHALEKRQKELENHGFQPKEVAKMLEQELPLKERLLSAGSLIQVLPTNYGPTSWVSLHTLKLHGYDPKSATLIPLKNFTPYPDITFEKLRQLHTSLEKAFLDNDSETIEKYANLLSELLLDSYRTHLEGGSFQAESTLETFFPSLLRFSLEGYYYDYPLQGLAIFFYSVALLFFFLAFTLKRKLLNTWGIGSTISAFLFHTLLLGLRCYIFYTLPFSERAEAMLYVSWVAVIVGFALHFFYPSRLILSSSALTAILFLSLFGVIDFSGRIENMQPLIEIKYLLALNVLMVVGSYGVFIMGGLLAQAYLMLLVNKRYHRRRLHFLAKSIFQTIVVGLLLLIPGSGLEGLWMKGLLNSFWGEEGQLIYKAIPSLFYLCTLLLYRSRFIANFGLAVASIIGFLSITFLWFSAQNSAESEKIASYLLFFLAETAFLSYVISIRWRRASSLRKKFSQ